ncbi:MAG: type II toxin-antitoxin system ParD family antitoxin [Neorhizobium sp.]|nr:type II toxin-antitoxin system ParD family antitoxin [Neorhizobium sp.]
MTEIHLSDEHRAFIEEQVKDGTYENAGDVVSDALRLLSSEKRKFAELRQLLQEGLDDVAAGRVHSYNSAEEMLADIKQMSAARKAGERY